MVQIRFIALLKLPFKSSDDYPCIGWDKAGGRGESLIGVDRGRTMARFEILDSDAAPLGAGPISCEMSSDMLFELGMMYSVGRDTAIDLVAAHKWFNLAAVKGSTEAIRLRREVADQMSDAEIAVAQRAARDWLRGNHAAQAPIHAMAA
jgi:uncharacterized protein